jgi:hypothetical protein
MNKTCIIGNGEVGKSLYDVLSEYYPTFIRGLENLELEGVEYMHICFPYSETFVQEVLKYKEQYKPRFTIIHSTVPAGTSTQCQATHSPIRGNHPFLAKSIRTFVKFVGGKDANNVAEYFRRAGMKVHICRKSETTELAKIADTTFYAVCIEFVKELERLCDKHKVPFAEAFTIYQETYNRGWTELGYPEYQRPVLQPIQRKQGGHCTIPNLEFYKKSRFAKLIKNLNCDK